MKKTLYLLIVITGLAACQSTQKNDFNTAPPPVVTKDTAAAKAQSEMDKIADELSPPDSNYTGDFFLKYESGVIKTRGYFRFGKRHGQWFYFYPNGQIWSEALFENGLMNGPSVVHHPNGKTYYEGSYKLDKAFGTWKFYDTSGVLAITKNYDSLGVEKTAPVKQDKK